MIYEKWRDLKHLGRSETCKVGDRFVWVSDNNVYPAGTVLKVIATGECGRVAVFDRDDIDGDSAITIFDSVWALRLARLPEETHDDEQEILDLLKDRMRAGRELYGPWKVTDGRNYPKEALEEVLDAMHYCAARLLQLSREENDDR